MLEVLGCIEEKGRVKGARFFAGLVVFSFKLNLCSPADRRINQNAPPGEGERFLEYGPFLDTFTWNVGVSFCKNNNNNSVLQTPRSALMARVRFYEGGQDVENQLCQEQD